MNTFALACRADAIPAGEGRAAFVDGVRVAIFNTPAGWRALADACPHAAGPLADGIVADASVTCPLHQRRFDLASGAPIGHDCAAVQAFAVEQRGEHLYVCVDVVALAA